MLAEKCEKETHFFLQNQKKKKKLLVRKDRRIFNSCLANDEIVAYLLLHDMPQKLFSCFFSTFTSGFIFSLYFLIFIIILNMSNLITHFGIGY